MTITEALRYATAKPFPPPPTAEELSRIRRGREAALASDREGGSKPPFASSVSDMPVLSLMGDDFSTDNARTVSPDRLPKPVPPPLPQSPQKPIGQRPVTPTKPGGNSVLKRTEDLPPSLQKAAESEPPAKQRLGAEPSFTLLKPKVSAAFRKALAAYRKSKQATSPTTVQWEQGLEPPTQ